MSHTNIALFVSHIGCPNTCSFCNQHIISGKVETAKAADVEKAIKTALDSGREKAQLAFFGGSFTAIDRDYMTELLEAAYPFVKDGSISGIRVSTRPDAIDRDVLDILKKYGVEAIELGAQSMSDEVLLMNRRGHSSDDVRAASLLIKEYGFELGLQMMVGLYGDTPKGALYTAKELIKLAPDTVRIYPTVVLEGTELDSLYRAGVYKPCTVEEAVDICSELLTMFESNGIKVIRLGLHSGGNVEDGYVAGAYHPALRELCESKIYFDKVLRELEEKCASKDVSYKISVNPKEISKMTGQKHSNIVKLKDKGFACRVCQNDKLGKNEFCIEVDTK